MPHFILDISIVQSKKAAHYITFFNGTFYTAHYTLSEYVQSMKPQLFYTDPSNTLDNMIYNGELFNLERLRS